MNMPYRLRLGIAATAGLLALTAPSAASMPSDITPTLSGSYLAARSADAAKDIKAGAGFYAEAAALDPGNQELIERLLVLRLAEGDMEGAVKPARELLEVAPGSAIAHIALAVDAIQHKDDPALAQALDEVDRTPLAVLTIGLMKAWADFGAGKTNEALGDIAALSGPSWYGIFKDYHTALILDAAGRTDEAVETIGKAYHTDGSALRVVEAYARILAASGKRDVAAKALTDFAGENPLHPAVRQLLADIRSDAPIPPVASTVETGAAEALYGLGSAIGVDGGADVPVAYLQMAVALDPKLYLATMAIGDILQSANRYEDAIKVYERIPQDAVLRRNADLQIANCYQSLEKPGEAVSYVERVLAADPKDFEAAVELGNVYRADDRFAEAAEAYGKGIASIEKETADDWRIYYFRGVALERSKQWPKAEEDFRHALKLNPDQPQVLNYLGYSWIDQGLNLKEAMQMIQTAVDLRPNDGYIVDSLGWAHYRLGDYQAAVETLEQAIQLRPEDSTINDHLGDAYWQVGRKLEATFQWAHARDLDPDKDQLPVILDKLQHGLKAASTSKAGVLKDDPPPQKAALKVEAEPNIIVVAKGESLWDIAARIYGNAEMYEKIYEANRDRIRDPDRIFPGMTLNLPAAQAN
jgi:tetratricopeptide (TPR) repeat protein